MLVVEQSCGVVSEVPSFLFDAVTLAGLVSALSCGAFSWCESLLLGKEAPARYVYG